MPGNCRAERRWATTVLWKRSWCSTTTSAIDARSKVPSLAINNLLLFGVAKSNKKKLFLSGDAAATFSAPILAKRDKIWLVPQIWFQAIYEKGNVFPSVLSNYLTLFPQKTCRLITHSTKPLHISVATRFSKSHFMENDWFELLIQGTDHLVYQPCFIPVPLNSLISLQFDGNKMLLSLMVERERGAKRHKSDVLWIDLYVIAVYWGQQNLG